MITQEMINDFDREWRKLLRAGLNDKANTIRHFADAAYYDRFMRYVEIDPDTGCWNWKGGQTRKGKAGSYGLFCAYPSGAGRMASAHRVSYVLHCGVIQDGYEVGHTCHNTLCVSPLHLELQTHSINMRACRDAGRQSHTKLTPARVQLMRWLRSCFRLSHKTLGRLFGISPETIGNILTGHAWRDIEMPDQTADWRLHIDFDSRKITRLPDFTTSTPPIRKAGPRHYWKRPIITPMGEFDSIQACSNATGLASGTIHYRLNSPNQTAWMYRGSPGE
jgi:hypothetical protein